MHKLFSRGRQKPIAALPSCLLLSPWLSGFAVLAAGPLVFSFVMTFYNWSITGTPHFAGLQNYIDLFARDAPFYNSPALVFQFAVVFVPLNLALALFWPC